MKTMQTLAEIEQQESERRSRAWQYGKAKDALFAAKGRLETLEQQLAAPTPDISALTQILAVLPHVPDGIVTKGTPTTPGGQSLRFVIEHEVQSALARLTAKRKQLEAELPKAKQRLAEVEARIKALTDQA